MKVDTFSEQLQQELNPQMNAALDLGVLVPILLQVLMDMLGNCGGVQRAKDLARQPKSLITRYAMRRAVNQMEKESSMSLMYSDRQAIQSGTLQAIAKLNDVELSSLLSEAKQASDYTLI